MFDVLKRLHKDFCVSTVREFITAIQKPNALTDRTAIVHGFVAIAYTENRIINLCLANVHGTGRLNIQMQRSEAVVEQVCYSLI